MEIFAIIRSRLPGESAEQHSHFLPRVGTSPTIRDQHPDQPEGALIQVLRRREID